MNKNRIIKIITDPYCDNCKHDFYNSCPADHIQIKAETNPVITQCDGREVLIPWVELFLGDNDIKENDYICNMSAISTQINLIKLLNDYEKYLKTI